ncbi:cysteine-rich CWC family protein [Phototrophicus methaneseepsis]|uniref:Cysteine-rich CWC family protein n=2 Tax=Phototrophicus methaneseepsis TaxID=2710758 RepID=A0A7S8E9N1_9CHLR|nr:cysteine-rich CWC family protein [Phototrophicus methaneseepsis]
MTQHTHAHSSVDLRKGQRICPRCGTPFVCGVAAGKGECWCFQMPMIIPLPESDGAATCLCPYCLQERIEQQMQSRIHGDTAGSHRYD